MVEWLSLSLVIWKISCFDLNHPKYLNHIKISNILNVLSTKIGDFFLMTFNEWSKAEHVFFNFTHGEMCLKIILFLFETMNGCWSWFDLHSLYYLDFASCLVNIVTESVLDLFCICLFCLVVNLSNGQMSNSHPQNHIHIYSKQTYSLRNKVKEMKTASGFHIHEKK